MKKSTEGLVYHLNLTREDVQGARIALLPGDPGRVPRIARSIHSQAWQIAYNREFRTFICGFKNENILVASTGIGGPSTSIAVEELAQLGIRSFIRVGTTGAIQDEIEIRLYYTHAEIAHLDESSLRLRWWDGSAWIECSDAGVHTGDINSYSGYIWARIRGDTTPTLADLTGTAFGGGGTVRKTGDVNGDGNVNVLDMIRIGMHWGETGPPGWIPEDVNQDGVINVLDMILVGMNWTR